ncbi:hypothetical protein M514_07524 [Trichuris suis]|uniref:Uncharacterized protein n=1 Tax=Trichuris suis TaxID=68888 RepID=A0A085NE95_9BILA|nr:hypothetical protein M513_07524 [Trichuris suis]KFD67791.1 hypothetical protein M514_07524 [Trichuris suis]
MNNREGQWNLLKSLSINMQTGIGLKHCMLTELTTLTARRGVTTGFDVSKLLHRVNRSDSADS